MRYILFAILWISPSIIHAQNIDYEARNQNLGSLLEQIKYQYDLHFSYDSKDISPIRVSVKAQGIPLAAFLETVLRPHGLAFEINKNNYIIIRSITDTGLHFGLQIKDQDDQSPLPFATIQIKGKTEGTIADEAGNFKLHIENPDTTHLIISFLGYAPLEISVMDFYKKGLQDVKLQRSNQVLAEIMVIESIKKIAAFDDDILKISIKPADFETYPGTSNRDLQSAVQLLPGVSAFQSSASGIQIRGSTDDQGLSYWDRIPVYLPSHHFGTLSSISPSMVQQINIYRSGAPVSFGGSSAGLIEMLAPSQIPSKARFELGLGLSQGELFGAIPLFKQKQSIFVDIRTSHNQWINTPPLKSIQEKIFELRPATLKDNISQDHKNLIHQSRLHYLDYQYKWIAQINARTQLSLSGFYAKNSQTFQDNLAERSDSLFHDHQASNTGLNLYLEKKKSANQLTSLSASYSDYRLDYKHQSNHEAASSLHSSDRQNRFRNAEIKWIKEFNRPSQEGLLLGLQANYLSTEAMLHHRDSLSEDFEDVFQAKGGVLSAFINYRWQKDPQWRIETGFRFDYFHFLNSYSWNPSLKLYYQAKPWWQFKFSFGIYEQYLHSLSDAEFNPNHLTENIWVLADQKNLPLLENIHLTTGALIHYQGWQLDAELYYKNLRALSAYRLDVSVDSVFSQGTASITGLDLLLRKVWGHYQTDLSYSLAYSNYHFPTNTDVRFPGFLDIRHQFKWGHHFQAGSFDFALFWTFQSGLPYSQPQGLEYRENTNPSQEDFYTLDWAEINTKRLPATHRLDAAAWYKFPKESHGASWQGKIGLSLLNTYQRHNTWTRFYTPTLGEGTKALILSKDRQALPFTMNITALLIF